MSRVRSLLCCCSFGLGILLFAGCGGPSGPKMYKITGTVTVDGAPLPIGTVLLLPVDGAGGSFGADVLDGRFEIQSSAGEKTVMINGYRLSETQLGPTGKPGTEQYLPDQYNRDSILKLTVSDAGPFEANFPLESQTSKRTGGKVSSR